MEVEFAVPFEVLSQTNMEGDVLLSINGTSWELKKLLIETTPTKRDI